MTTLALRLDHYLHPRDDRAAALEVGRILALPCFGALKRMFRRKGDRDSGHGVKSGDEIARVLGDPDIDAVAFDSGRTGELVATAEVSTGRHVQTYDEPKPPLSSHIVLPYVPDDLDAVLDAYVKLGEALQADAGYIAVEPNYGLGHAAALAMRPRRQDVRDYPRRGKERVAHSLWSGRVAAEIAMPEWGIVLGPKHIEKVDPVAGDVFAVVRPIGSRAKLALVTEDPTDALEPDFDAKLDRVRQALALIMMDVSSVRAG